MSRQSRTKLVPLKTKPENQLLEIIEESSLPEQKEEFVLPELDMEIELKLWNYAPASMNWCTPVKAVTFYSLR